MSVRGDVTFEAGGKKYTARFGFLAYEHIEERFDAPFMVAIKRIFPDLSPEDAIDPIKLAAAGANIRMGNIGAFFEAALMKHHGGMSRGEIADLIDEIGLAEASRVVSEAVQASIGDDAGGDGAAGANPPKRPKGKTG